MSDDDSDGIITGAGPPPLDPSDNDSDGVILPGRRTGGSAGAVRPRVGRKQPRPNPAPRRGSFQAWLVADGPLEHPPGRDAADLPDCLVSPRTAFGLATLEWECEPENNLTAKVRYDELSNIKDARHRHAETWGFLEYTVTKVWTFSDPPAVSDGIDLDGVFAHLRLRQDFGAHRLTTGERLSDFLAESPYMFCSIMQLPSTVLWEVSLGLPLVVRSVRLAMRTAIDQVVPDHPPEKFITQRREDENVVRAAPIIRRGVDEETQHRDKLLELPQSADKIPEISGIDEPGKGKRRWDPMLLVNAVLLSRHLRNVASFFRSYGGLPELRQRRFR
jgi:hypothetical protein